MLCKVTKRRNEEENSKKMELTKQIPKDILLTIFEFLHPKDLFNIFLANKNFYEIAHDDYLWQQYCQIILKGKTKLLKTWKEQFKFYLGKRFPIIKCGEYYSLILVENGTLFSSGKNNVGQLGLKDYENRNTFHKVPFDKKIIQICASDQHTLVLTEDYHVYSCGFNNYGQLGLNDTTDRNEFEWISSLKEKKIIQIECGYRHSCALTDDGFVYSWGFNMHGQLGHGDTEDRTIPTLINGLTKIKKNYCGMHHIMAINENDEIYVWGSNHNGELGLGEFGTKRLKPTLNTFFKNKKIKKIACGYYHFLVLLENGEVYSWGGNGGGQLGHGDRIYRNTPELISFFKGMNVMDIFAFYEQSFVILENYDIYAFGWTSSGQTALSFATIILMVHVSTPHKIEFFRNKKIVNIEGGRSHTFFITESDKIYGVGSATEGQLGIHTNKTAEYEPKLILNSSLM